MLDYADITEEVCIRCGDCCKIYAPVSGNERYLNFIKEIGLPFVQDDAKTIRISLGYCPKLEKKEQDGEILFLCSIYGSRPQLCKDFNCVAWAKVSNTYDKSEFIKKASEIYGKLDKLE